MEDKNMRVLNTPEGVAGARKMARAAYASGWKAKFGFPVPQELLDRWWPTEEKP
jgi:hypothetical protein